MALTVALATFLLFFLTLHVRLSFICPRLYDSTSRCCGCTIYHFVHPSFHCPDLDKPLHFLYYDCATLMVYGGVTITMKKENEATSFPGG